MKNRGSTKCDILGKIQNKRFCPLLFSPFCPFIPFNIFSAKEIKSFEMLSFELNNLFLLPIEPPPPNISPVDNCNNGFENRAFFLEACFERVLMMK